MDKAKFKRFLLFAVICSIFFLCLTAFLNIKVITRQGINDEQHIISVPLYLKVLDFLDRHYNYKILAERITKGSKSDTQKAMKIFEWTCSNMRRKPESLPVIDDHAWHIIIRGYGVNDQFQDVFTTLCNHAGLNAFFSMVPEEPNGKKGKSLSFVKLNGKWSVFDVYNGVYFVDDKGDVADKDELLSGNWKTICISGEQVAIPYGKNFRNLNLIDFRNWNYNRAAIQSPFRRLIFWVKRE